MRWMVCDSHSPTLSDSATIEVSTKVAGESGLAAFNEPVFTGKPDQPQTDACPV
jgi:hypothetical protein